MNTNSDLPENRPQDSSAEAASTPAPAASADQTAPVGQPAPAATAPTEQLAAPAASTATETTAETTADAKPRRRIGKRTWIIGGAVAGVLVLGGAGFAIADELNDGADSLDDATRDRVASAATAYTGGGELIDAERDDNGGYDAEVRLENGTEVDLDLDENFAVISSDTDRTDDDGDRSGDDRDGVSDDKVSDDEDSDSSTTPTTGTGDDARVDDDTPLTADETTAATEAALAEVGQGEVVDIDRSDDRDHAFEVEVRLTDGSEVEVDLDADFGVVSTSPSD